MRKKIVEKLLTYFILLLIILSLPYFNNSKSDADGNISFTLENVKTVYPQAVSFKANSDRSFSALNKDGENEGNFIVSNNFLTSNVGYSGELNVMIAFVDDLISGVVLLDNVESRSYVRRVENSGLFDKWNGVGLMDAPIYDVDAVGGATFTSNAVIKGVKESTAGYLSVKAASTISYYDLFKRVLFLLVVVLSVVVVFRKNMSKYRFIYLIILIGVFGFWLRTMLSISLFDAWLKQGVPFSNSWMSITLLALALIMPAFGKNRYYCNFLCPMGALQELTGKISPFKKYSLKFLKFKYFNINDVFLALVIVAMFSSFGVDLAYVEPFTAYAVEVASWGMLLFGVLVVVFSLFFNRPWCAMCPTGCALDHLSLPN